MERGFELWRSGELEATGRTNQFNEVRWGEKTSSYMVSISRLSDGEWDTILDAAQVIADEHLYPQTGKQRSSSRASSNASQFEDERSMIF